MQRRKRGISLAVLCFMVFVVNKQISYAQDLPAGYEMTIKKSDDDKIEINLLEEDDKLAYAISEASFIAFHRQEDKVNVDYKSCKKIVKICRYNYDLKKETIPFVDYVENFMKEKWANCSNWKKYYKAFLN